MTDRVLGDIDVWRCTEPAPDRNPHEECDRERAAAEREIDRLSLALKLRHEHEQLTKGARVELATSLHAYECPACELERPRSVCCFEVRPYHGEAFYTCHACVGRVLCERFPQFTPTTVIDEDTLPW